MAGLCLVLTFLVPLDKFRSLNEDGLVYKHQGANFWKGNLLQCLLKYQYFLFWSFNYFCTNLVILILKMVDFQSLHPHYLLMCYIFENNHPKILLHRSHHFNKFQTTPSAALWLNISHKLEQSRLQTMSRTLFQSHSLIG